MGDSHARMAVLIENASLSRAEDATRNDKGSQSRTATSTLAEFFATTGPEDAYSSTTPVSKPKKSIAALDFLRRRKSPTTAQEQASVPKSVITKTTADGVRYKEIRATESLQSTSVQSDTASQSAEATARGNLYSLMPFSKHESKDKSQMRSDTSERDTVLPRQIGTDNSWSSSLSANSYEPDCCIVRPHKISHGSVVAPVVQEGSASLDDRNGFRPRPVQRTSDDGSSSAYRKVEHAPMFRPETISRTPSTNTIPGHGLRRFADAHAEELRRLSATSDDSEISLSHSLRLLQAISERGADERHKESLEAPSQPTADSVNASRSSSLSTDATLSSSIPMPRIAPPQSITALLRQAAASQRTTKYNASQVRNSIEEHLDHNLRPTSDPSTFSDVLLYGQMDHTITSGAPVLLYQQSSVPRATAKREKATMQASDPSRDVSNNSQSERDLFADRLKSLEERNQCLEEALILLLADRNARPA